MSGTHPARVLAIAPGAQHIGLAIVEGEELIWYAVKSFDGPKTAESLRVRAERFLDGVVAAYEPAILATEEPFYTQARLSPLIRALTRSVKQWGRRKRLRVVSYTPPTVKDRLLAGSKTRNALAEEMVRRYWFLYHYRKPGRTRRYWQHMFNAVALGILAAQDAVK